MTAQSDKIGRELAQAVAELKRETAERLLENVKERTPVRTGATQAAWHLTEDGVANDRGEVVMRLNDGHSRKAPAAFIESAIDETIVEIQRRVKP